MNSLNRRGVLLYIVLALVMVMTVLIVQFHQMAMHGQRTAFRFGESESCRLLAEAGMEEAFQWVNQQSETPTSPFGTWLITKGREPFPVPLDLVTQEKPRLVNSSGNPEIKAVARILDTRPHGEDGIAYQPGETHGNLEIEVSVAIQPRFMKSGSTRTCRLVQHFDYQILKLESRRPPDDPRTAYSSVFPLDYVLMVRDGMKEFRQHSEFSLNSPAVHWEIHQPDNPELRGKICFGGTDTGKPSTAAPDQFPRENYVFVNLDEKSRHLVPVPKILRQEITQEQLQSLLPSWNNSTGKRWKGVFEMAAHPVAKSDDLTREEDKPRKAVTEELLKTVRGSEANLSPGFQLLATAGARFPDKAETEKMFEGEIRGRFLYAVSFHLEEEGSAAQSGSASPASSPIPGFPNPLVCVGNPEVHPEGSLPREFLEKLRTFPQGPQVLTSKFDASMPLCAYSQPIDFANPTGNGLPQFRQPSFFSWKNTPVEAADLGWEKFMPFRYFDLWSPKQIHADQLGKAGIVFPDKNLIKLHGMHQIYVDENGGDELILGGPEPWTISGRGVLIAHSIRIRGELKKATPDDLCVLFTPGGTISVETEKPIAAFLCSIGDSSYNGRVKISRALNLSGGLMVDRLDLSDGAGKGVSIIYDPTGISADFLQVVFFHYPTFRRYSETSDEGGEQP